MNLLSYESEKWHVIKFVLQVYNKPKMMMRKEKLFHFWFNTHFVTHEVGAERVPPPIDSECITDLATLAIRLISCTIGYCAG